jgi:hypothetical protein
MSRLPMLPGGRVPAARLTKRPKIADPFCSSAEWRELVCDRAPSRAAMRGSFFPLTVIRRPQTTLLFAPGTLVTNLARQLHCFET